MRILVLGAGGLGGYFGGRLAKAGLDVTFLVRPRRAGQLAANGLVVTSPLGDFSLPVKTVLREDAKPGYDVILLSCKAYDLADSIESIRGAADGAVIVPVLNGVRHLDTLDAAFGATHVTGGVALIGATLDADGTVRHLDRAQGLVWGARSPDQAAFCAALDAALKPGGFDSRNSDAIMQEMWEKFVFLCSLAAMTTLMRNTAGAINHTAFGTPVMLDTLEECSATASAAGFGPRPQRMAAYTKMLTDPASGAAASMMRDMVGGHRVEADHVVGDMLHRARAARLGAPTLRAAYTQLQVYEAGRATG